MPDYGLLGGIGEGLSQGVAAYRAERKQQDDDDLKAQELANKRIYYDYLKGKAAGSHGVYEKMKQQVSLAKGGMRGTFDDTGTMFSNIENDPSLPHPKGARSLDDEMALVNARNSHYLTPEQQLAENEKNRSNKLESVGQQTAHYLTPEEQIAQKEADRQNRLAAIAKTTEHYLTPEQQIAESQKNRDNKLDVVDEQGDASLERQDLANQGGIDKQEVANRGGLIKQGLINKGGIERQGLINKGGMDKQQSANDSALQNLRYKTKADAVKTQYVQGQLNDRQEVTGQQQENIQGLKSDTAMDIENLRHSDRISKATSDADIAEAKQIHDKNTMLINAKGKGVGDPVFDEDGNITSFGTPNPKDTDKTFQKSQDRVLKGRLKGLIPKFDKDGNPIPYEWKNDPNYQKNKSLIDYLMQHDMNEAKLKNLQRTPYEKKGQEKYAVSMAEWETKDRPQMEKNIGNLDNALNILKTNNDITGPMKAQIPDAIRKISNPNAIIVRDSIANVIQETLRPILGAQFTENEGKRIQALAFDMALPQKENIRRSQELRDSLARKMQFTNDLHDYLQSNHGDDNGFPYGKYRMQRLGAPQPAQGNSVTVNRELSPDKLSKLQNALKNEPPGPRRDEIKRVLKLHGK